MHGALRYICPALSPAPPYINTRSDGYTNPHPPQGYFPVDTVLTNNPMSLPTTLESLPVELIATILSNLDLESLVKVSNLSRRLRHVASDSTLNPWRRPIAQNLASGHYERSFYHFSFRSIVPASNWIDILTLAPPGFILFESSLPNLKASEWEECFRKRFIPGWLKWKKDNTWRVSYIKCVHLMFSQAFERE